MFVVAPVVVYEELPVQGADQKGLGDGLEMLLWAVAQFMGDIDGQSTRRNPVSRDMPHQGKVVLPSDVFRRS